jgi:Putative transposase, YhgA-like
VSTADSTTTASYDEPWKSALEQYFEAFMALFFPQAHAEIDWQRGYESLDQEFQQVVREAEIGKRFVDKLVKVWLRDGEETWLLLHIEVQSQTDTDFAKRMYSYHYRIFDRYDQEVVSLAVLGDEQKNWRPCTYSYGRWGCQMNLEFPIVKLLDYETRWEELEASPNPFAVVVMAHLKTQVTTQDPQGRLRWKLQLIRGLYERGFSQQDILELFRVLDWMMGLPELLKLEFWDELQRFEEDKKMPYISTVEQIGIQQGHREVILSILKSRFGDLDENLTKIVEPLTRMPPDEFTPLLLNLSREELVNRFIH